ncbi:hypothetical protein BDV33DRAFT_196644 [Aspergillus novoparasiticus]|uniref:CFEM domain-containing protein n=1 Tax=Aspergillus novoparasiticus TaxID=986946 RepID=A0A5N6EAH0_9EURO|nr:hypothetical protein BDV33DRAFT_196644 [Aspergillus novoparasiticus]
MKLSLAVSLTALVAAVMAQNVPPCLAECIEEVNICHGIDIPCFCDRKDFHLAMRQCMGGNDGKSGKCSEGDQKTALVFQTSVCGPPKV